MQKWYESLFENYGKKYDEEPFTKGTAGECDFIEQELGFDRSRKILDIGCGTGRHSIELARRGYSLTGIDLSESQLEQARKKAHTADGHVEFYQHDARELPFTNMFDAAIMLCEGAFPLMETDDMNFQILLNAARALKKTTESTLIFTTLNGLFPLFHSVKDFLAADSNDSVAHYKDNSFDLMTFREHNTTTITDDDGNKKVLQCNERYYVPPEITWLLRSVGFRNVDIFGAKLGAFSRTDTLTTEDYEMLVVAKDLSLAQG